MHLQIMLHVTFVIVAYNFQSSSISIVLSLLSSCTFYIHCVHARAWVGCTKTNNPFRSVHLDLKCLISAFFITAPMRLRRFPAVLLFNDFAQLPSSGHNPSYHSCPPVTFYATTPTSCIIYLYIYTYRKRNLYLYF